MNTISKACKLAGGQSAVARALSTPEKTLTPQAVGSWCRSGKIPAIWVIPLENLVAGQVTRHELDPIIYPLAA